MYHWRTSLDSTLGPVDLAFTDRYGGASAVPFAELNLALEGEDDPAVCAANLRLVADDFAPGAVVADMRQVHGGAVDVVEDRHSTDRPEVDALVTRRTDTVLVVRVADCVPVLLADAEAGVIAAAHAGRPGMKAGVVHTTIADMVARGARPERIVAVTGPSVCGLCYEVPAEMRDDVAAVVPASRAETRQGTPALDVPEGVWSQLAAAGINMDDSIRLRVCSQESDDHYSFRGEGTTGRFAGFVWLQDQPR